MPVSAQQQLVSGGRHDGLAGVVEAVDGGHPGDRRDDRERVEPLALAPAGRQ